MPLSAPLPHPQATTELMEELEATVLPALVEVRRPAGGPCSPASVPWVPSCLLSCSDSPANTRSSPLSQHHTQQELDVAELVAAAETMEQAKLSAPLAPQLTAA